MLRVCEYHNNRTNKQTNIFTRKKKQQKKSIYLILDNCRASAGWMTKKGLKSMQKTGEKTNKQTNQIKTKEEARERISGKPSSRRPFGINV